MKVIMSLILSIIFLAVGCSKPIENNSTGDTPTNMNILQIPQTEIPESNNSPTMGAFVPNEVLVIFKAGTTPDRMQQIATSIGGTVVDPWTEGKTAYKITLNKSSEDIAAVQTAMESLKQFPEVNIAEPNAIITIPDCSKGPC